MMPLLPLVTNPAELLGPMSPLENPCRCEEIRADPGRDGIQHRRL